MYRLAIKQYLERHGFEALRPKAVLFDMDGVLYDSMPKHAIAWQQSMASFGIHMTADDAYATEGARGVDTIRQMVRRQQSRSAKPKPSGCTTRRPTSSTHLRKPP